MEQGKLGTLKEMTEESFANRPQQAPEAIKEYLDNIDASEAARITKKFEDAQYLEKFKVAITHTSLMVFIAAFRATQDTVPVDFNQYSREFMLYARDDDKDIFQMRTFYLGNLNAEEMGIGEDDSHELDSEEEKAAYAHEVQQARNTYDNLINGLLQKYTESKIHIA